MIRRAPRRHRGPSLSRPPPHPAHVDSAALIHIEHPPAPPLRRFVRCLWLLESPAGAPSPPADRVLPDGCVEAVVHFHDTFERDEPGGGTTRNTCALVGQIRTSLLLRPLGRVGVLGIRFEPAGAGLLLRQTMRDLAGRSAVLGDVLGATADALAGAVACARTPRARIAAAEAILRPLAASASARRSLAEEASAALAGSFGMRSLSDVCEELGAAGRRLERRFLDEVGIPPKSLARILRFQSAVRLLRAHPALPLAHVAADAGYCDQAHLTRDFTEFAGEPPGRWRAAEHALAAAFV